MIVYNTVETKYERSLTKEYTTATEMLFKKEIFDWFNCIN